MKPPRITYLGLFWIAILTPGCGLALLQTAKTTPKGDLDIGLAAGYVHNKMLKERGSGISNFPVHLGLRYGLSDQLDLGATLFLAGGGLVDFKYNFVPKERRWALSLQGGLGVASDLVGDSGATVLHLPVRAIVSCEFLDGRLSPYAAIAYGAFWILGYQTQTTVPDDEVADRAGHGDGLLMTTAGLQVRVHRDIRLFLEYGLLRPVLDDPGDNFAFTTNHIFQIGMLF